MDMEPVNRIQDIRDTIETLKDKRVKVRANMGRSRIVEHEGLVICVHPALFVMEVEEKRGRTARQSYQFVDILTGTVELYDIETGSSYFEIPSE